MSVAAIAQPRVEDVRRFHQWSPTLASSGQPKADQFPAIAAAGFKVVINLVPIGPHEGLKGEKEIVEAAGMQYFNVPVDWGKPRVEDVIEAMDLLDRFNGTPVLVHCTLNARGSAFMAMYRIHRLGMPKADEYATMKRIWSLNRGVEYENVPQWQFLVEDVEEKLGKRVQMKAAAGVRFAYRQPTGCSSPLRCS